MREGEGEDAESESAHAPDVPAPGKLSLAEASRPLWHPVMELAALGLPPDILRRPAADHRWGLEEGIATDEHGRVRWSGGAVRLRRRIMSAAERAVLAERKRAHPGFLAAPTTRSTLETRVSPVLQERLAVLPEGELLEVFVVMRRRVVLPPVFMQLEPEIAAGTIQTAGEYHRRRLELLAERQALAAVDQQHLAQRVTRHGGTVKRLCPSSFRCLTALVSAEVFEALVADPDIASLETPETTVQNLTNGIVLTAEPGPLLCSPRPCGSGLAAFLNAGYDGEREPGPADDLYMAIIEHEDFHDDHRGFRDDAASDSTRFGERVVCGSDYCLSIDDFPTPPVPPSPDFEGLSHPTMVAGIAIGDLMDGQDVRITDDTSRRLGSGIAREARAHLLKIEGVVNHRAPTDNVLNTLGTVWTLTPRPVVAVLSQQLGDDPSCLGNSAEGRAVNDYLYESGVLAITAAGNLGHASQTACTVISPGTAVGAFTVGAHAAAEDPDPLVPPPPASISDVVSAPIAPISSRGGQIGELGNPGRGRGIVDLTAYGAVRELFYSVSNPATSPGGSDSGYGELYARAGTSVAAPIVAGAAIDFVSYFKARPQDFNKWDAFIDQPGVLFANLLLMGDRQGETGNCQPPEDSRLCRGFDSLWGAGRLRMRRADQLGPNSAWRTGSMCLEMWEANYVPINDGQPLPEDVDSLTAVLYWYDPFHADGAYTDIDLSLEIEDDMFNALAESDTVGDNRERIHHSSPGGKALALRVYAFDVDPRDRGCGPRSIRVYWAYFWQVEGSGGIDIG